MAVDPEGARVYKVLIDLSGTTTAVQELEIVAGSGVTLTPVQTGPRVVLTIAASGGGGGAPTGASYVTLGTDATLTAERVLTAGHGIDIVDAGAGSTITVDVDETELDLASMGGTLDVASGGTGSTTASGARTNLGLGSIAVESVTAGGDLAGSWPAPTVTQARGLRETAGPTTLTMGAVADGQLLKRSGATIIGVYVVLAHLLPAQSGPYNVLTPTGQHTTFTGSTWV